jgi:hypothetical protein
LILMALPRGLQQLFNINDLVESGTSNASIQIHSFLAEGVPPTWWPDSAFRADERFFHFNMVLGLTPYRVARALKLS